MQPKIKALLPSKINDQKLLQIYYCMTYFCLSVCEKLTLRKRKYMIVYNFPTIKLKTQASRLKVCCFWFLGSLLSGNFDVKDV